MYLKSLEMNGFKSFATKTKLGFEPGMTAIVGPNGCGKSNVSDAIRWVLGEKSAKALRGANMADVIFTGTDSHKPMGMAEVSLTLADCETALNIEYNEVTITRRINRSGESQYLINKTPCRLKDIQRLFMDTGIGTNSYSVMEQGRIDMILSSRPEDRRAVFEEASGITKFKADKKEALRKLDHTEANLLRLDDIIREVRRQIISLQRQAGKARRYKTMQDQLRAFDLFFTCGRLEEFDKEIGLLEARLARLNEQDEALRADVQRMEQLTTESRDSIQKMEQQVSDIMEAVALARSEWDRSNELIRVNKERIEEMNALSERESRDADEAQQRLVGHRDALAGMEGEIGKAVQQRDVVNGELKTEAERLQSESDRVEEVGQLLHDLRSELVDLESRSAKVQNELSDLEAEERTTVVRRERLAAEKSDVQHAVETFQERQANMEGHLQELEAVSSRHERDVEEFLQNREQRQEQSQCLQARLSEVKSETAAKRAQIELLEQRESESEGFPGGTRLLLDQDIPIAFDRTKMLGTLAERVQPAEAYRVAFEVVLRAWLDAVVLEHDRDAIDLLEELQHRAEGSARVLAVATDSEAWKPSDHSHGTALLDHVECAASVQPLVSRLLQRVFVVETVRDLAQKVAWDVTLVTRDGCLRRGDGSIEYWMPSEQESNPVARQQMLRTWRDRLAELEAEQSSTQKQFDDLHADDETLKSRLHELRESRQQAQERVAESRGQQQAVAQELVQAKERLETVSYELNALLEQDSSGDQQREQILASLEQIRSRQSEARTTIADNTNQLRRHEQERSQLNAKVTELRVKYVERSQRAEALEAQKASLTARVDEQESVLRDRETGLSGYRSRIGELAKEMEGAAAKLDPLHLDVERLQAELVELRKQRDSMRVEQESVERQLREKRGMLEEVGNGRSNLAVEKAEATLRRQTMLDRIGSEYHLSAEDLKAIEEPEWESEEPPDAETLETMVGELRAKLESMGPVNLVAIDEHRELEERYAFLTQQQDDLVNAKQQLMEMIRTINKTTTELFTDTFNRVNENFQEMFKRLFGGGTAKLVLVDDEDVLESGIEIIARPPGKKLQSVSLLSGGERTMTAVGLLFSVYMVKPSPFCVLDELDAALDEANIGRFVDVVKGFVESSQFIIITHSRKTIGAADVLYGVTMEQRGISKIVSVKFSEYEDSPKPVQPSSSSMSTS